MQRREIDKNAGPSRDEIISAFYDYYYFLGSQGACKNRLGSKELKCNCLKIVADDLCTCKVVADYIYDWGFKGYAEKQEPFILWRQMVELFSIFPGGSYKQFLLTVNTINVPNFEMNTVCSNKICTLALLLMFLEGRTFLTNAMTAADLCCRPTRHGNVGTMNHYFKSNNPLTIALFTHF